ncbi:DNA polymerase V [Erysiphe neolycopersici]|uniref:DNA polymerase V n=1 Tax=Erysiphe neolycopersici TaxID=212602 RepID=A0A420HS90_9PEZI|nr:DNA polymerase V [Erysiphe neolycopersici]
MGGKRKRGSHCVDDESQKSKKLSCESPDRPITTENYPIPDNRLLFVEKPTGDELKREVELYERLASEDERQRIDAANDIISKLFNGETVSEQTVLRHLERRLFRGLASGRKGARLGFGVVLTEILSQMFGINGRFSKDRHISIKFETIFDFLKAKTKPEGDLSGQEIKDHALGLLFGLQCFVRAKILFANTEHWKLVLDEIIGLAKRKSWMRQECGWIVVEALEQMNYEQVILTLIALYDNGLSKTPEGVGIWLIVRNKFESIQPESLPKIWGNSANPFDDLPSLAKVLRESSGPEKNGEKSKDNNQAKKKGDWNAKLHFVWDIVLDYFTTKIQKEETSYKEEFADFWKVAVDENLFAPTASRERKFWGFQVFQKVLKDVEAFGSVISSIFSQNLLRCLINHTQDKDRFLNRAAERSLIAIVNAARTVRKILPEVLLNLIHGNGAYNFDRVTKTKTICQLLDLVTDDNCKKVISELENIANDVHGDDEEAILREVEPRRLMLGDYLLQIIRKPIEINKKLSHSSKAVTLNALARLSYSQIDGIKPSISEKSRIMFRSRLMSAFTHILKDVENYHYIYNTLRKCDTSAIEMDSSIKELDAKAKSNLSKIQKKLRSGSGNDNVVLQALTLLYTLMIFQLYNGESEAVMCLDELDLCYQKLVRKKVAESETLVLDVLVELLLSLISKPSALLRKVAHFVFEAFVSQVTETGLKLMTDILTTSESLSGQKNLFDEEEEEINIALSEKKIDQFSDVELIDEKVEDDTTNTQVNSTSEHDHCDTSTEESNDDQEKDEGEEDLEKLNTALATVLGATNMDTADESNSDADMTDSEMLALDDKLVEIFAQHQRRQSIPRKKKEQKEAKENICHFKTRVLDLIEIYVKKQAHNKLAFNLLVPLLHLIHTTQTKSLADKSHAIIQIFVKTFKNSQSSSLSSITGGEQQQEQSSPDNEIQLERIVILKEIHGLVTKGVPSYMFCKAASSASLLLVSSIFRVNPNSIKEVANIYRDTQVNWVLYGHASIQTVLFTDWINWCQSHILLDSKRKKPN